MNKKTTIFIALAAVMITLILGMATLWEGAEDNQGAAHVSTFEECVEAGYPVMESYPERCTTPDGNTFVREIGNELEKADLIQVARPRPGAEVGHDVEVVGEARGYWFFEATLPVEVQSSAGETIGEGFVEAGADWMTESFVPFTGSVEIEEGYAGDATLVLRRANPSGLPENADELVVPIVVTQAINSEGTADPEPGASGEVSAGDCYVGGCSGQVCSDNPNAISTCEWRPEYACYSTAVCERQASGECGWTQTQELEQCLARSGEQSL